jgi:hypothetical protein
MLVESVKMILSKITTKTAPKPNRNVELVADRKRIGWF